MNEKWITPQEAGALLERPIEYIHCLHSRGKLRRKGVKNPAPSDCKFLFLRSQIETFLEERNIWLSYVQDKKWVSQSEAMDILQCSSGLLRSLRDDGVLIERYLDNMFNDSQKVFYFKPDLMHFKKNKNPIHRRNVATQRRAQRPKSDQPDVAEDIEALLAGWSGSPDQRRFKKRYSRQA